ncbi:peptidase inhibitor family I36 protein [Streptomyces zaomyceticus]|uniref:peptidase inhibitor family I36 protein n=1 Tax=Streptomyces zaomyceticus TaxID=68286 RepID=UPI002E24E3B1
MKINILRGSLITGALALLGSALIALPANAAEFGDCSQDRLCLYTAEGGLTAEGDTRLPRNYATNVTPQGYSEFDNQTKSVWNRTGEWACLYTETRWGGSVQAVKPGDQVLALNAELSAPGAGVSSHKFAPSRALCFSGFERCTDGQLCLFKEKNGRGEMTDLDGSRNLYSDSWNDKVKSVWNRTDSMVCFYNDTYHGGAFVTDTTPAQTYRAFRVLADDATNLIAPYEDSFGSHRFDANADSLEDCKP